MTDAITEDDEKGLVKKIIQRLVEIYVEIPTFECKHCHECDGPIIWFKPEEILIRDYLWKHNLDYIVWSTEEFKQHNMRCPYLQQERCSIYPVRPIVCRLQGTIVELPCPLSSHRYLPREQFDRIKHEFELLVRESGGMGVCYGTRKYIQESP